MYDRRLNAVLDLFLLVDALELLCYYSTHYYIPLEIIPSSIARVNWFLNGRVKCKVKVLVNNLTYRFGRRENAS
jgi:hypothetical protein